MRPTAPSARVTIARSACSKHCTPRLLGTQRRTRTPAAPQDSGPQTPLSCRRLQPATQPSPQSAWASLASAQRGCWSLKLEQCCHLVSCLTGHRAHTCHLCVHVRPCRLLLPRQAGSLTGSLWGLRSCLCLCWFRPLWNRLGPAALLPSLWDRSMAEPGWLAPCSAERSAARRSRVDVALTQATRTL